ncbi:MAG: cobalt ECF transporter T component CbiQ [Aphanizomenon flos-aquae Clear-A1]|jgi:cobalt/nickel transport system permease protein|uniref:Cobalt transporter n=1 Tax=Aphanizomenon flos-aquae LD13 TaxID=1710894 RepID=A0A1B7VIE0_APHFL|nr:cobalt ECF transporter T component CbiQ [Aphanizomenon flos-aquae Clear-A1]MBO1043613.1 cobalt ECF transporter T component CbiQ [Aphanizomenon flos-aquae UKL13-PB]NTW21353.1 cobalt ECF transporter T component CbiQ [Nostocales cyanobacterium W4_Combined_metabat2_030]OBQ18508.1 MAG: cobalt transporter [Aphanizomenon flos-aquae LD13]HCQ20835.1 cobalt ECF transporter T component CbiQ [Anabaena sp. UBA12330]
MTLKLDTLAYTNQLRRLPPEHKIIFAFTTLIISLCSHPLVQILIVIWMSIWTVIYAKIPAGIYLRLLTFTIVFCLTSLPALMVNGVAISHLEIVKLDAFYGLNFGDFYIYISRSGSIQAWGILIRALASVSCLYFLMLTVPFTEVLQTLRWLRFPVLLTDLLLLMYRFIFILLKTANELWTAQNSRSGYRNWYTSMKSLALLIGQLLQRTLQQYSQFSLGLQARGFAGELRFWYPRRYRLSRRYTIEAICGCVILIGLEICQNAGIFTRI